MICVCVSSSPPPPKKSAPDHAEGGEAEPLLPIPPAQRLRPEPDGDGAVRGVPERGGAARWSTVAQVPAREPPVLRGEAGFGAQEQLQQHQNAVKRGMIPPPPPTPNPAEPRLPLAAALEPRFLSNGRGHADATGFDVDWLDRLERMPGYWRKLWKWKLAFEVMFTFAIEVKCVPSPKADHVGRAEDPANDHMVTTVLLPWGTRPNKDKLQWEM